MILRTENISKLYNKKPVVNGVSINLKQGEIVGLLGPNGAGKTTTFYSIVGLIKVNFGKVYIDDFDITSMPMYKRAQMNSFLEMKQWNKCVVIEKHYKI